MTWRKSQVDTWPKSQFLSWLFGR